MPRRPPTTNPHQMVRMIAPPTTPTFIKPCFSKRLLPSPTSIPKQWLSRTSGISSPSSSTSTPATTIGGAINSFSLLAVGKYSLQHHILEDAPALGYPD